MRIGTKNIGSDSQYFVIEEDQANLGNFDKALQMIDVANETGAASKFIFLYLR